MPDAPPTEQRPAQQIVAPPAALPKPPPAPVENNPVSDAVKTANLSKPAIKAPAPMVKPPVPGEIPKPPPTTPNPLHNQAPPLSKAPAPIPSSIKAPPPMAPKPLGTTAPTADQKMQPRSLGAMPAPTIPIPSNIPGGAGSKVLPKNPFSSSSIPASPGTPKSLSSSSTPKPPTTANPSASQAPRPQKAPEPPATKDIPKIEGEISLPKSLIAKSIPQDLVSPSAATAQGHVSIPAQKILGQLQLGRIVLTVGEVAEKAPDLLADPAASLDQQVILPLASIFPLIPKEMLQRREGQKELKLEGEEIPTPFSERAKADAERLASSASAPPKEASSSRVPAPPPPKGPSASNIPLAPVTTPITPTSKAVASPLSTPAEAARPQTAPISKDAAPQIPAPPATKKQIPISTPLSPPSSPSMAAPVIPPLAKAPAPSLGAKPAPKPAILATPAAPAPVPPVAPAPATALSEWSFSDSLAALVGAESGQALTVESLSAYLTSLHGVDGCLLASPSQQGPRIYATFAENRTQQFTSQVVPMLESKLTRHLEPLQLGEAKRITLDCEAQNLSIFKVGKVSVLLTHKKRFLAKSVLEQTLKITQELAQTA
ncbi:MAG: hypothetical protein SFY92_06815 [Verrucomicrobiae bacterium]|nr:hypothetical protein [Verrucomicrobiae bacterium]